MEDLALAQVYLATISAMLTGGLFLYGMRLLIHREDNALGIVYVLVSSALVLGAAATVWLG